jgi:hypothetical protein
MRKFEDIPEAQKRATSKIERGSKNGLGFTRICVHIRRDRKVATVTRGILAFFWFSGTGLGSLILQACLKSRSDSITPDVFLRQPFAKLTLQ